VKKESERQEREKHAGKEGKHERLKKKHDDLKTQWKKHKKGATAANDVTKPTGVSLKPHQELPLDDLKVHLKSFKENKASGVLEKESSKTKPKSNREKMKQGQVELQKMLERVFVKAKENPGLEISAFKAKEWNDIASQYKKLLKGDVSKKGTQGEMAGLEKKMKREIKENRPSHTGLSENKMNKMIEKKPFRIFNQMVKGVKLSAVKKELDEVEEFLKKGKLTTFAAFQKVHAMIDRGAIPSGWIMKKDAKIVHSLFKNAKKSKSQQL
jgi:hypothetical protein